MFQTRHTVATVFLGVFASIVSGDTVAIPAEYDRFRPVIGEWRGVGQVRRGSSRGAWKETAEWRFDFSSEKPAVVLDVTDGEHVDEVIVRSTNDGLNAELVRKDGSRLPLAVEAVDTRKTVFESDSGEATDVRLTLTRLNEKRTLLLIEERKSGSKLFRRVGEVGYTKAGTKLATDGANGPECIVTGGLGTIAVTHKGKTYYVCCTGCKQAFEADPEAILAEAASRRAEPGKLADESP